MNIIDKTLDNLGFENFNVFTDSTFHPKLMSLNFSLSTILATIGYYFEQFIGFEPLVGMTMIGLFLLELFTGVKASIREGNKFESKKFGRAWLKMVVYILMIGFANVLAVHVKVKPIFGVEFNYYEWLHYAFFNFVILNLFVSNIENATRLGWDEFVPILGKISSWLKLKNNNHEED